LNYGGFEDLSMRGFEVGPWSHPQILESSNPHQMHLENQHNIKDVLKDLVGEMRWKEPLNEAKVREVWKEKMGTTINTYTKDITLRKGKLYIYITSAPLKQEMSYEKEKIQKMMNSELGGAFVTDVVIR
jgi:predicted nucleic acid-binding Zn ribbon protein